VQIGGDIATRFKYAPVESTTFNLTPAEILLASDAELNAYMGVKKYATYRKGKERWDASQGERLRELKGKVGARAWGAWRTGGGEEGDGSDKKKAKRKGKKEREREKVAPPAPAEPAPAMVAEGKKDGKRKKQTEVEVEDAGEETHRPKRRRKKKDNGE